MNHDQMAWRCPGAVYQGAYHLRGWQLAFGCHATIVPRRGHSVPGALWRINLDHLDRLDRYEGWPTYYRRRCWNQDGQKIFFYEMTDLSGMPSPEYIQSIAQGYQDCGLELDYLERSVQDKLTGYDNDRILST